MKKSELPPKKLKSALQTVLLLREVFQHLAKGYSFLPFSNLAHLTLFKICLHFHGARFG